MTIIKIAPNANGSHDNQTTSTPMPVPEGYAVVPKELGTPETLENYPFGEVTVKVFEDVPTVTSWTPLPIPEPEPEPQAGYTAEDMINALLG